ncbi:hypothetical protein SDC9_94425 [bioreactor metagenome]|uniref:Schlafen AlbA-2 domain-containing protein n=1 Tax=bioreactor metagenome TaxID=1076179 RepID=A0A645A625_9ZZZZ
MCGGFNGAVSEIDERGLIKVYSPFSDKKGNSLDITKIRFAHLEQLKEVDEGYKVEYKSSFDKAVKDKIPAIITSFANSEGGWLIIGIDDNSHDITCIPKLRSDYSQTISQLLKAKTSPIPSFDSKFLPNPKNNKEGVLVVEVYEGRFSPYIANGTVYIRNGSSKEPIKSERSTIDYLYQKSQGFQDMLNGFCKRDIYFPNNTISMGIGRITYPICNIYYKNINQHPKYKLESYDDFNSLKENITSIFEGTIFSNVQHTFNSLVFRHRPLDPSVPSITPTMEIFYDFSAKIHVPMGFSSDDERIAAINILKNNGFISREDIKICSGVDSFNCVFGTLKNLATIYDYYKVPVSDVAVCFEMENSDNTVLFFDGSIFLNQATKNGLCYCSRIQSKSRIIFLKDFKDLDHQSVASSLAYDFFLAEFGFASNDTSEMVLQAAKEKYPDIGDY